MYLYVCMAVVVTRFWSSQAGGEVCSEAVFLLLHAL